MNKLKKCLFLTVLLFGIMYQPTPIVHAEDDTTTININIQAMNNIRTTKNEISVIGTTLFSNSLTSSTISPDTVGLRIYLQVKNNSTKNWNNTGKSREYLAYDSKSIDKSTSFSVSKGYHYRIKIVHFVKEGGVYESKITYSTIINLK